MNIELDEKHRYWITDNVGRRQVPSVTQILGYTLAKPALIQWAANQASAYWRDNLPAGIDDPAGMYEAARLAHRQTRDKAADKGTEIHAAIEKYIKTGDVSIDAEPDIAAAVDAFAAWSERNVKSFLESERIIYYNRGGLEYAGTYDFKAVLKAKDAEELDVVICDVKTGKGLYPEYWLQLTAYWGADVISGGFPAHAQPRVALIHYDQSKQKISVEYRDLCDIRVDWEVWISVCRAYKWLKEMCDE